MQVQRITRIAEVIRLWDFFREGIAYEARYLRYSYPIDTYRKILCHLVAKNPNAWVGVAYDDIDPTHPIAFLLSHDVTPLFSPDREYEVSMFYFRPGNKAAIRKLQQSFNHFCRENKIRQYYLTTSSFSSSAKRIFRDSWSGLERAYTVFKFRT